MECNTLNDPTNKLNKYVTESIKGFFQYHLSRVKNVIKFENFSIISIISMK